jgi:RNA polymerase sigma factor for flagellar operon FliA
LQRAPTEQELADKLGMTENELQNALLEIANSSVYALDELWTVSDSSGDQVSLLDTIADEGATDPQEALASNEVKDRLTEAIGSLPEREQLVVALYYYENLTLREIGEVLGVTESRVSQLHTKAVMRLKSHLAQA